MPAQNHNIVGYRKATDCNSRILTELQMYWGYMGQTMIESQYKAAVHDKCMARYNVSA
jgi:hypothetical protein